MSDQIQNPLMAKVKLPGRIFQLPSRGLFYQNGELNSTVKNGELHVHPLSALAEIHMKNADQLFSGQAVETVFRECISGVAQPSALLSKDVDAIMMFLRAVTYGPNYEFTATHNCAHAKEHSYIADVDQMINDMKMIDPTTLDQTFQVTLPNGQTVFMQPSRYGHVVNLLKDNEGKTEITVDDMKRNVITMVSNVITRVDDITDQAFIKEWLSSISAPWMNRITEKMEALGDWGPTLRWKGICKDCGGEFEVDLPINPVSFFTE